MLDKTECSIHGPQEQAFVCSHLVGDAVGLGFNRDIPAENKQFPDAWCDDCEIIRVAHGGWTEESEKLLKVSLVCARCYERSRIRNTKTSITLGDLAALRWKCGSCEEWHSGPCLDFGYSSPYYWKNNNDQVDYSTSPNEGLAKTFLTTDFCAIDGEYFFVRGLIELPIVGTGEHLRWGVWGSLSRQNFETLFRMDDDPKRVELPPMFSWLSSHVAEYPETLSLKMYAHIQKPGSRPHFELEETDHPLSQEYHHGITVGRVKEIMLRRLPEAR